MALNTNIGPGLLSSRTFRYGYDPEPSVSFVPIPSTGGNDLRGDYLSFTKYNFETESYDTENYIFCRTGGSDPYTGSSGDVVNIGDNVGEGISTSINSNVKGIAVTFVSSTDSAVSMTDELITAFNSPNSRIQWENVTEPSSSEVKVFTSDYELDDTPVYYYSWDGTTATSVVGTPGVFPFAFGGGAFPLSFSPDPILNGPLDTYEDKFIKLGRIVNAAGLTKAGLTNINNDTALTAPDALVAPPDATQQTRARVMAIASYAYKKKKK